MNLQQSIIRGIRELLFHNDYLVLPNFGGFVLKSKPAHFSVPGGTLVPPSKTVSFNVQLKQNDGLLVNWVQTRLQCSPTEALKHLNEFSEYCSGILRAKRRLTLDGIGFFYLDFENNICFEPLSEANFSADSFGLSPLPLKAIELPAEEPRREKMFEDRVLSQTEQKHGETQDETNSRKRNRRWQTITYKRALRVGALALVFVSFLSLLVSNSHISGQLKSAISGGSSSGVYQPESYEPIRLAGSAGGLQPYVADVNGIAALNLGSERVIAVKAVGSVINRKAVVKRSHRKGNFEIVMGCFTIHSNAKKLTRILSSKHIPSYISGKNNRGMYVVSCGSFATRQDAQEKLIELKSEFQNAWIRRLE